MSCIFRYLPRSLPSPPKVIRSWPPPLPFRARSQGEDLDIVSGNTYKRWHLVWGAETRQRRQDGSGSALNVGRTREAERCGEHWLVGAGGGIASEGSLVSQGWG